MTNFFVLEICVHWIFFAFIFCVLTLWYLKLLCHSEPAERSGRGENRMGGFITCNSSCYFQPGIVKRSCAIYRLPDAILTQNLSWMFEAVPNFCIILNNLIILHPLYTCTNTIILSKWSVTKCFFFVLGLGVGDVLPDCEEYTNKVGYFSSNFSVWIQKHRFPSTKPLLLYDCQILKLWLLWFYWLFCIYFTLSLNGTYKYNL